MDATTTPPTPVPLVRHASAKAMESLRASGAVCLRAAMAAPCDAGAA